MTGGFMSAAPIVCGDHSVSNRKRTSMKWRLSLLIPIYLGSCAPSQPVAPPMLGTEPQKTISREEAAKVAVNRFAPGRVLLCVRVHLGQQFLDNTAMGPTSAASHVISALGAADPALSYHGKFKLLIATSTQAACYPEAKQLSIEASYTISDDPFFFDARYWFARAGGNRELLLSERQAWRTAEPPMEDAGAVLQDALTQHLIKSGRELAPVVLLSIGVGGQYIIK